MLSQLFMDRTNHSYNFIYTKKLTSVLLPFPKTLRRPVNYVHQVCTLSHVNSTEQYVRIEMFHRKFSISYSKIRKLIGSKKSNLKHTQIWQ